MFVADYSMKQYFFDAPRVLAATTKAERSVMSRQGAFIKRRVRTDILRRTQSKGRRLVERGLDGRFKRGRQVVSRPGQPPIIRSRDKVANLRNILFAYNPARHTVVIGPVGLNQRLRGSSAQTVPELLEKGGTASIAQWAPGDSNIWNFGQSRKPNTKSRTVAGRYSAHPFMGPGLTKEVAAGTIIGPWSGVVR